MKASKVYLTKRGVKLPSGRRVCYWTLKWYDRRGRARWKSVGRMGKVSRTSAEAAKRQMIVALSNGKVRQDKPSRTTLGEFIDFHEQTFGHGKNPTTLIEWRIAGNHAVEALGDKLLDEVVWSDAGEIRAHLDRKGRSQATIRKTLSMFRAMLGRAVKRGMLPENPLADEELGPPISRPKRIFSHADLDAMIEVADVWWKAAIMLAHTSGLRRAELLHLRWSDFDARTGMVRVEEHHKGRYVATGRDVPILAWQPKTKRSTRTVAILRDLNQPFTITICEGVELAGTGSFIKDNPLIKPNKKQHLIRSINRAQNFFKHAANDPDAKLDFRPEWSEFLLFDACLMYRNITGRHLREGSLFMMWYMVKYPEIFLDGASKRFIALCQAGDFTADKPVILESIKSGTPIPGTD